MARIKPQIHYVINGYETKYIFENTYRNLKKRIVEAINLSSETTVMVYRFRRGEWGEWWETWKLDGNNKPHIIDSGWS